MGGLHPEMPDFWCGLEDARVSAARRLAIHHREPAMGLGDYGSSARRSSSSTGMGEGSSSSGSGLRRDGPTEPHATDAEPSGDHAGKGGTERNVAQLGQLGQHEQDLPVGPKNFVLMEPSDMQTTEIYDMDWTAPPRVTKRASRHGLLAGGALDLTTGWDLSKLDVQRKALELTAKTKPALLILSSPCATFSALRNLSTQRRAGKNTSC